ncbi:MAG: hypothetical protein WCW26_05400 [Candidatus Buchananbacteria bacterium]
MRRILFSLFLSISILSLTACQTKETYSLQAALSEEKITETRFEIKTDGVELTLPLNDFSCNPGSFQPLLTRSDSIFSVVLSGQETESRCQEKFYAKLIGVKSGDYKFKVIYKKNNQEQNLFEKEFTIAK